MHLAAGVRLGPYAIDSAIGAGGMGEVWKARDTTLGRNVALKILPDHFALDPDRLARFKREAQILASLNHPKIATIHGFQESDGVQALVLELVEGSTLADRIAQGPIRVDEALPIAQQIAEALEAAHEQGIVHRDLKPANIKVRPDGTVKVLDFGLAKALESPEATSSSASQSPTMTSPALTLRGVILGTAAYMSPEQARGKAADKRSDIWAFGCVLYEMLTGRAAFDRNTVTDTLVAVVDRDPDWKALPPETPPAIVRLLRRSLEKDPKRRLHDIVDARLEIDEARDVPATAGPSPVESRRVPPRSRVRRLGERLAWVAGAAILMLVGSWFNTTRSRAPAVVALSVLPPGGTTFHGEGAYPAVAPDGTQIVFVAIASGGQQQLWIRRLDTTVSRALDGTEGGTRPFWSPDSRSVAFFANGELRRIDVDTGSVRVICDAPYAGGAAGTWGKDTIVIAGLPGGLARVPASGGQLEIVVPHREDADVQTPAFLPDGRHFVYTTARAQPEQSQICIASLDSPERSCILNAHSPARYVAPGYLLFIRDTALHAQSFDADQLEVSGEAFRIGEAQVDAANVYNPPLFSASDTGILAYHSRVTTGALVWLDRSGRPLGAALGPGGRPALSPDETRIAVQRRDSQSDNTDLWLYDRSRDTASRFTFDPADDSWPAFSPDGEHVLFLSNRTGRALLYQKPASGDGVEQPLVPPTSGASPDWSSDGKFIIYQRGGGPKTGFDLWALPLSGERREFPVARTEHGEREGRFSPDVRWVAYDSTEAGQRDVWIQPFPPTGARWQISTRGGVSPQWRRDGKELYFVAADGMMTAVPIDTGTTLEWGALQPLFQTTSRGGTYANYAVSRDGQRFLTNVPPSLEETLPITVVMNWTSVLRR